MSNKARWEYFRTVYGRYQKGDRKMRQTILNEFCLNTGYHRKSAIRLLNGANPGPWASPAGVRRKRAPSYGPKTLAVLTAVWEAAGYPWSVRLKAILPTWMPWIRQRFGIGPERKRELLAISPRQMDRRLGEQKRQARRRLYGQPSRKWGRRCPSPCEEWIATRARNSSTGICRPGARVRTFN